MRTETQATLNAIQFFNPVLPPPPGSFTPTTLTWGQRLQMLVVVQDVFKHTYTVRSSLPAFPLLAGSHILLPGRNV